MASPNDVLPALFRALHDRLAGSAAASDIQPGHLTPIARPFQPSSNALLVSLSSSNPHVQRGILQEIRHDASTSRLQLLRSKRLGLKRTREANEIQKQQVEAVVAAESDTVLLDASTHDRKFQFIAAETHHKATVRLQTLFFECIAEIKKALVRMEGFAADTSEESESRIGELLSRHEWQLFLARLQQDCGGDIDLSLLYPRPCDKSSKCTDLFRSTAQPTSSKVSMKAVLQRVLQQHGPAMENGGTLTAQSVISLRRTQTRRVPEKTNRLTPSLHFGASAGELWTEVLAKMTKKPTKPRRLTASSSSSTRRIRRLPPTKSTAEANTLDSNYCTNSGDCSRFRQLATEATVQFPGTACDVPLSSVYIQWMIPTKCSAVRAPNATTGRPMPANVADYNIYFDVAEYEHNLAAIMQNYAVSAALNETSTPIPNDRAVLASARRSLRAISAIFERTCEHKEGCSADTIFASRQIPRGKNYGSPNQTQESGLFARASVLQLVQTLYYSNAFLKLLPGDDVDVLRKLYPSALFGEGCLSTLYIPITTEVGDSEEQQDQAITSTNKVFMLPLNDQAIRELLLIYVARGRRALMHEGVEFNRLTSLALSDAVNTLVPSRQMDRSQQVGVHFCVIKNPRGLWKPDKWVSQQDIPEEFETFTNADIIFAECTVSSTQGENVEGRRGSSKPHSVLETLGSSCMWRSCLISGDIQNNANLCQWHASIQRFLEFDESTQYAPNENRVREVMPDVDSNSPIARMKRVIQTSSSLLEELSSWHLPLSIKAFYDHVVNATSNRVYQAELLETATLADVTNGITPVSDLEQSRDELQRLVDVSEEVLGTENCVTRELQQLLQLTVYPGVEDAFVQHGVFDLEELQSDIRTHDPELLLRLSQQKLQILVRRRKNEERQIVRRLGSSASVPSMSFHSAPKHQTESSNTEPSSSVEDVMHIMRKGRQSLRRQQSLEAKEGDIRNGFNQSAQPSRSLERCTSDMVYRVSPYEAKAVKYRVGSGRRVRK